MAPSAVEDSGRIARVIVLLRLHHLGDRQFDYLIPEHLTAELSVGSVVTVPFGKRTARAVVLGIAVQAEVPEEGLRAIQEIGPDRVPEELIDLAQALLGVARPVAVRPEQMRILVPGAPVDAGWVACPGTVADSQYHGATLRVQVRTGSGELLTVAGSDVAADQKTSGIGSAVNVGWPRSSVIELEADPA